MERRVFNEYRRPDIHINRLIILERVYWVSLVRLKTERVIKLKLKNNINIDDYEELEYTIVRVNSYKFLIAFEAMFFFLPSSKNREINVTIRGKHVV